MTHKPADRSVYADIYKGHGPDPADFEPADVAIVVPEVRQHVLSDAARANLRRQAREVALQAMTGAEWDRRRAESGDPVRADVEMAFGDKGTSH